MRNFNITAESGIESRIISYINMNKYMHKGMLFLKLNIDKNNNINQSHAY